MTEHQHPVSEDKVLTWPHLLSRELIAAMATLVFLWAVSLFVNAPLEMQANPTHSPNPAKAPWYFLGLQELLVYFDPWIAGVMIPLFLIIGLMLIPYMDPGQKATGVYTVRERPFAVTYFIIGLVLWFGLIGIGTFLRGQSWNWYWPWQDAAINKAVPALHNMGLLSGLSMIFIYFGLGWYLPRRLGFLKSLGSVRYSTVIFMVLCTTGIVLKIVLRLLFDIKYVVMTPWFNI